jgi:hypothetical protein
MFPSNLHVIRVATPADEPALRELAGLDSQSALRGRILVGELAGVPAAAISLDDGRLIADPFKRTSSLAVHLRLRANATLAHEREPSLAARVRAGVRVQRAASAA